MLPFAPATMKVPVASVFAETNVDPAPPKKVPLLLTTKVPKLVVELLTVWKLPTVVPKFKLVRNCTVLVVLPSPITQPMLFEPVTVVAVCWMVCVPVVFTKFTIAPGESLEVFVSVPPVRARLP